MKIIKNLELAVSGSIIVLYRSNGGDAVRVGTAMLWTQLRARHILQGGGPMSHALMSVWMIILSYDTAWIYIQMISEIKENFKLQ